MGIFLPTDVGVAAFAPPLKTQQGVDSSISEPRQDKAGTWLWKPPEHLGPAATRHSNSVVHGEDTSLAFPYSLASESAARHINISFLTPPMHQLDHPENYVFSLSKLTFTGLEYFKKSQILFRTQINYSG